ncbi:autotransporter outer membrane beta-barrel domain-containing protein [Paraburkholderia aspalathi]|nr:autotransporter outer membrane beta-barrel domain-containing protein [Paraburkholderia aspalathi]
MGVSLPQGGTISNMPGGVITGATTGISLGGNGSTVYNAGTITGTGGTAIDFSSQAAGALSNLTLDTGSVLNGNVLGGPGTNNLILAGTNTEDISKFSNFQTLTMQGDDWTLNGNGAFSSSATLSSGTLHVNGTLTVPATTIAPGATLAGFGTVTGNVSNAGTVAPGSGIAGSTNFGSLTISGNYVGAGGTLALNTYLGADNSPSDKLVINGGTATGTTSLAVTNAGGPGASSTANGIAVVQAINGGTTAAGAFSLAGEVRAGAYDYRLFQGGVAGSDPNDWFLRSTMAVPPVTPTPTPVTPPPTTTPASPTVTSPEDPQPVTPPDDLGTVPPAAQSNSLPIIGPEIATYSVVQPVARQLGLTTLGTMHERIGATLTEADGGAGNEGWGHSGWVRLFGQQIDNRYQSFTDANASGKQVGFEMGVDLWRGSFLPGHHDAAGVYYSYGNSSVDVDGLITNAAATAYVTSHTGSLDLDAYSGGAYWTHYGPGGWYVDAVFQGTYYDGQASTQFAQLPVKGSGLITSLEAGYPVPLPFGPGFVLEPQAQVIWQHVGLSEANDGLGAVDLGSTSGVSGRLGVRGQWTITRQNGQVWQPYVRANLWRDWGAQASTTYSGIDQVPVVGQATRMDVATGVTAKIDTHMSVYGQFGYQFSVNSSDSGSRKGVWGDIGVRYLW